MYVLSPTSTKPKYRRIKMEKWKKKERKEPKFIFIISWDSTAENLKAGSFIVAFFWRKSEIFINRFFNQLEFRGSRVSRFVGEMVLWMIGWGSQRNLGGFARMCHSSKWPQMVYFRLTRCLHFLFGVGVTVKKYLGGAKHPPLGRTRVKTE